MRAVNDREGILPEHVGADPEPVVPPAREIRMRDVDLQADRPVPLAAGQRVEVQGHGLARTEDLVAVL